MDVHIAMPVCWGFQDRCAHSYRCVLGGRGGGGCGSYVLQDEGDCRQIGRGSKAMKAKDRITVIFGPMHLAAVKFNQ